VATLIRDLDTRVRNLTAPTTAAVRAVRRDFSHALRNASGREIIALADALIARDAPFDRFLAYELVAAHPAAMELLGPAPLRRLGRGIDSWEDVDCFASYLAGPAWRERRVPDAEIRRWARSPDPWWRRAAVVSTVPLNNRTRGGSGDAKRTLAVCRLVVDDEHPMVAKALSWALRELAKRDAAVIEQFVAAHESRLPALVRREVRSKLTTGLKSPRRVK
jgi:3-methyladenine DNA glycosylase AlkD